MVFSSILFLFLFLPLLIVYYVTPFKFKNLIILILSLVFYSWGEPHYLFLILGSILISYVIAIVMENNRENKLISKIMVILSIVFNIGVLLFFKYYNFFAENINNIFKCDIPILNLVLPLGISFYVFQILSYTIDVYRGKVSAEKNIINFSAFVVLFPQLIAGPIVKYTDINGELNYRKISLIDIQDGIRMFILGLGKKVIIANNIGMLWTNVEAIGFEKISSPLAWLGIIGFSLQIYFDFSGYSLMAIGLGRMLGFNFPQNFNFPYISRSITEFWRRWHITLSSWFKEYVYIPLGGSRCSRFRMCFNLFIVWFCTGFWHGANWNFICWGLFFFCVLMVEKFYLKDFLNNHRIISHIYVIFLLLMSWSLFAITDITNLKIFIIKLFSCDFTTDWIYYLRNYFFTIVLGVIFSTPIINRVYYKLIKNSYIDVVISVTILVISVAYLVDATYNPFLYFRF